MCHERECVRVLRECLGVLLGCVIKVCYRDFYSFALLVCASMSIQFNSCLGLGLAHLQYSDPVNRFLHDADAVVFVLEQC